MADPQQPAQPAQPTPAAAAAPAAAPSPAANAPKPRPRNPVFKMMGLPALPRKLPSRNWMIFWTVTTSFAAAIIYDKREKNRATAKWRRVVAPLATEPIASASQMPRKLTVYLEAPPGDSLRTAQDHFLEYVKPVLAASGLDWEFVQGRQQGDVRAAVAEKIRRTRKKQERPGEELPRTDESIIEDLRKRMGLSEYEGIKGDIVVGRHAWKEYIRGLHEGWLGSLDPPISSIVETPEPAPAEESSSAGGASTETEKPEEEKKEAENSEEKTEEKKPSRPPQPPPYNSPNDYESAIIPQCIPAEFSPSNIIAFPHRLGFRHTFVRLGRFLNRRALADDIGREVAAVCFAAARGWREVDGKYEQQSVLKHEENDWPKSTWKDEPPKEDEDEKKPAGPPKEKIWISSLVVDPRIMERMRRFEILPEDEARAAQIKVPEEEIEGWIKGKFRALFRWGGGLFESKPRGPNVGNLDD